MIVDGNFDDENKIVYKNFFEDSVVLGYTKEKTHLREFILRLTERYKKDLMHLTNMINEFLD